MGWSRASCRRSRASSRGTGIVQIDRGLQQGGHDRREGSRHRPAEVGALPGAAEGRQADRTHVRAVVGSRDGRGRRRRCSRASQAQPRPPASLGDGVLISGGVKMFMDGSGGARTAWMHEDWNKNFTRERHRQRRLPDDAARDYRQIVTDAAQRRHSRQHARDRRSRHRLGGRHLRPRAAAKPTRGLRHGIIHANTPTDHAIDVMARLQKEYDAGYPESQADVHVVDRRQLRGQSRTGARAAAVAVPNLRAEGDQVGRRLRLSASRRFRRGTACGRPSRARRSTAPTARRRSALQESVDIKTALRSYTIWAAHQLFLDDRIGSIEVGKDADIAVWDRDPYTVPTDSLKDMRCELTLFRGHIVYRAAP